MQLAVLQCYLVATVHLILYDTAVGHKFWMEISHYIIKLLAIYQKFKKVPIIKYISNSPHFLWSKFWAFRHRWPWE